MALQTITSKHRDLWQISIHVPHDLTYPDLDMDVGRIIREEICREWSGLDRLLVQFLESHSIRPRIVYPTLKEEKQSVYMRDIIGCLLPEITGREIIDLVEC